MDEVIEWAAHRGWRLMTAQDGQQYLVRSPFPQIGPDQGRTLQQAHEDFLDSVLILDLESLILDLE